MTENEECNVPKVLQDGITKIGPFEVHGGKYSPTKVGGWYPGDGDTHNDDLEVPDCPE